MVDFNVIFICLLAKEFFVGIILAFFISIPFYMAESAGIFIDFLRGSSSLQVTDPSTHSQSSPIGVFYNYIMIVIFYEIGGIFLFFNAFSTSYEIIPADSWFNHTFFTFQNPFWPFVATVIGKIFAVGLQLAAPSILAILMTELFLGIANRLAPQVQIVFLGMSLKSLSGLALLALGWYFIVQQMNKQSFLWLKELDKILPFLAK
ncbi:MAG: EscT/YscT/HrcT family type III secretion system export apparatus protein [Chlamydiales bacterium]|nr:EscT/YscT/HrcT family type III secretion system export apparatus protein [Chlamydiales bacterium]